LLARRVDRLESLADEIGRSGVTALPVPCDVADRASVDRALGAVLQKLGHVDLLVNNAGYGAHVLFKDHDIADIERMVQTNVLGTIYTIKAVLPSMRERRARLDRQPVVRCRQTRTAGRGGLLRHQVRRDGAVRGLSYELAPLGIHVMTVYPALVRTEMFNDAVLARMPDTAKRTFMEAPAFTHEVLRALARGQYEVTVPRYVNIAYLIRSLLPGVHRRMTRRLRLPVLPDLTS
jgi:short-subunit dehydrogenase